MYKLTKVLVLIVALACASSVLAQVTIDQLHGDQAWTMSGLHSGNQIRTCFYNDGMVGDRLSDEFGMEWPINSGHEYLSKSATMIAGEVEVMIVVGGRNSGNTSRLVDISRSAGAKVFHIEDESEIEASWFDGASKIGVTAGASTPDAVLESVISRLEEIGEIK